MTALRVRIYCDADRQVISAINDGDPAALAAALRMGGASPRSDALRLLISAVSRRQKDSLHLLPKRGRGKKDDPMLEVLAAIGPFDLRRGINPNVIGHLIGLLDAGVVWIGRRRAKRRGPRADRASMPQIWRDGFAIQNEIEKLARERARREASSAPHRSVIPVAEYPGIQAEAIRLFIEARPTLGNKEVAVRYAKRALKEVRELGLGRD